MFSTNAVPKNGAPTLKLLGSNLYFRNTELPGFKELLKKEDPDIVLLTEFTKIHQDVIKPFVANFPFHLEHPRNDGFGIAIYSRLAITDQEIVKLGRINTPQIKIDVILPTGQQARIYGVHLLAPETPAGLLGRNQQINDLQQRLQSSNTMPYILLGDFNISPWSSYYAELFDKTDLVEGNSVASWPVGLGSFGIPIDHCLHTSEFGLVQQRRGGQIGSDHYPIIIELAL